MTDVATPAAVAAAVSRLFDDDALQNKDRYGFSSFDVLLAQLRGLRDGGTSADAIASSLIEQVEKAAVDENRWEKLKDIVCGLGIQSKDIAHAIELTLSSDGGPQGAWARYWAYTALKAVGGTLRVRQLVGERILKEELTPLWLDLYSNAAAGAPLSIIQAYTTELSRAGSKLDWKDVRRRIPALLNSLGNKFFANGMKEIIAAAKTPADQSSLRAAVERYTGLRLEETPAEEAHQEKMQSDKGIAVAGKSAAIERHSEKIITLRGERTRIAQEAPIVTPLIKRYSRFRGQRPQRAAL